MLDNFNSTPRTDGAKKEFSLIKEGLYQVEVKDIVEKQKPDFKSPSILKNFLGFTFVILNDGEFRGRRLWQDVSAILPYPPMAGRKESWMHKVASAIEGHNITEDEAKLYNAEKFNAFVGRQLQVMVKHTPPKANGKIYANIDSVLAASSQLPGYESPAKSISSDEDIKLEDSDIPF